MTDIEDHLKNVQDALLTADKVMTAQAAEITRLREALSSETAAREKAERERDAAYSVLTLAWKSIGRFPGSVYDRLMSRIERLLKGRNFDYTDPDLTAAEAAIAGLTRKLEAAAGAREAARAAVERLANVQMNISLAEWSELSSAILAALSVPEPSSHHSDDIAVDQFAIAMKAKLAKKRAQGRRGWDDKSECTNAFLVKLLCEPVAKGDPVDVGNLAMMIHQRGERIC